MKRLPVTSYKEAVHKLLSLKKYIEENGQDQDQDLGDLEIEFRIGIYDQDRQTFETNIGKENFEKISEQLNSSDIWSEVLTKNTVDYFLNGRRLSIAGDEKICIKKNKLEVHDFVISGSKFDLRVSVSRELKTNKFQQEKANYIRVKDRTSYVHDIWSYDLTTIRSKDSNEPISYEFELEVLNFKDTTIHYLMHDGLIKIMDIIQMCEIIDDDSKIIPKN